MLLTNHPMTKDLMNTLKQLGYPLFKGDYNLNLIGIRSQDTQTNSFNDLLCVLFQLNGKWMLFTFPMTTDPGVFFRENPLCVEGTAIVAPGHHAGCWMIGAHQGKYKALVQRGEMTIYRDNDRDADLDTDGELIAGIFGINLHHASPSFTSVQVDKWSAGCQVLANPKDFDLVMALVNKSAEIYGPRFSYTLLTEDQLQ